MKKLVLFIASCLMVMTAYAGTNIGQYKSFDKLYDVEYQKTSDGAEYFNIAVQGEYKVDKPEIVLTGSDGIINFHNDLLTLRVKYLEWMKVAKDNNVTDMHKLIPIDFNSVIIGWYSSEWYFDFHEDLRWMFTVNVNDGGKITYVLVTGGKATSSSNEYITQKYYLMFQSLDELDSLIKLTDIDVIRKKLNNTTNQESLFN